MSNIEIEFFHDVICSFCYPMSYIMRQIQKALPEAKIIHRSFALVKSEDDFKEMFGSRQIAKQEIMSHWDQANQKDELHRFNIEGMKQTDFLFPTSMSGLYACKAAYFVTDDNGYWDLFDNLQEAFFARNLNIGLDEVIFDCVKAIKQIDFAAWQKAYKSEEIKQAVEADFLLAEKYSLWGVPCLVINGKHKMEGTQPFTLLLDKIKTVLNEA